jgi:hypothetical protein
VEGQGPGGQKAEQACLEKEERQRTGQEKFKEKKRPGRKKKKPKPDSGRKIKRRKSSTKVTFLLTIIT